MSNESRTFEPGIIGPADPEHVAKVSIEGWVDGPSEQPVDMEGLQETQRNYESDRKPSSPEFMEIARTRWPSVIFTVFVAVLGLSYAGKVMM